LIKLELGMPKSSVLYGEILSSITLNDGNWISFQGTFLLTRGNAERCMTG
jgi:hypothetical protein